MFRSINRCTSICASIMMIICRKCTCIRFYVSVFKGSPNPHHKRPQQPLSHIYIYTLDFLKVKSNIIKYQTSIQIWHLRKLEHFLPGHTEGVPTKRGSGWKGHWKMFCKLIEKTIPLWKRGIIWANYYDYIIPKPESSGHFGKIPLLFTTIWGDLGWGRHNCPESSCFLLVPTGKISIMGKVTDPGPTNRPRIPFAYHGAVFHHIVHG